MTQFTIFISTKNRQSEFTTDVKQRKKKKLNVNKFLLLEIWHRKSVLNSVSIRRMADRTLCQICMCIFEFSSNPTIASYDFYNAIFIVKKNKIV